MYSIKEFAKLINVTTQTLRNWDKTNKLKPFVLDSGHRRYTNEHLLEIKKIKNTDKINVVYCRESSKQQKNSLDEQVNKSLEFCVSKGISVNKVIKDFGSGLNYKRSGLLELLELIESDKIENLVVYYKDRLVRFGFEIFEHLCKIHNVNLIIIDDSETNKTKEQEFAEDLISIIHYFSMKLYGSRSYKQKIKKAEENILEITNEIIKG